MKKKKYSYTITEEQNFTCILIIHKIVFQISINNLLLSWF